MFVTCEVEMVQFAASGDKVEDASIGDIPASLELQPPQLRTIPGNQRQTPVRGPRASWQGDTRHALRSVSGVTCPDQPGQDTPHCRVRGQHHVIGEADTCPQLWLPGQDT